MKDLQRKDETQSRNYATDYHMHPIEAMVINQPPGSNMVGRLRPAPPTTVHIYGDRAETWEVINENDSVGTIELRRVVEKATQKVYTEWCLKQDGFVERDYQEVLREALVKKLDSKKYYVTIECGTAEGPGSRKKRRSDLFIWWIPP